MYEPNNALEEFKLIAKDYRNISDDVVRNETFGKLRRILMTELESHKNDADYAKYTDIGYIQGNLTRTESLFLTFYLLTENR